jgi:hypothetical protein
MGGNQLQNINIFETNDIVPVKESNVGATNANKNEEKYKNLEKNIWLTVPT